MGVGCLKNGLETVGNNLRIRELIMNAPIEVNGLNKSFGEVIERISFMLISGEIFRLSALNVSRKIFSSAYSSYM